MVAALVWTIEHPTDGVRIVDVPGIRARKQDVEKGHQLCSRIFLSLNVPQGYASASKTLPTHHLAGAHKRGAIYSSRPVPRCGRDRERHVLACRGWTGEMMAFLNILHAHAFRPTDLNVTRDAWKFFKSLLLHRQYSWNCSMNSQTAVMCSRSRACG